MRWELFLTPFIEAFLLTLAIGTAFLSVPSFRNRTWRFGARHGKVGHVPRLGGIAMVVAFALVLFIHPSLVITKQILGLITGSALVLLFGFWDDIIELSWKTQVFFQASLAMILFIFGIRIVSLPNPFGGIWTFPSEGFVIPIFGMLFIWLFLTMNAMNLLDGLDGLCGSVTFVTLMTIFFLSLKPEVNQPPIAIVAIIGAGAVAGFLVLNAPPAKILAGTVGSMFLGFLVAVLAVIAGTKIATALLVLSIPIADAVWVVGQRIRAGVPIFRPDRRHLHYRLRDLGWSERKIMGAFTVVTSFIAFIALNTQAVGKLFAIIMVLAIVFVFLFVVERLTVRTRT